LGHLKQLLVRQALAHKCSATQDKSSGVTGTTAGMSLCFAGVGTARLAAAAAGYAADMNGSGAAHGQHKEFNAYCLTYHCVIIWRMTLLQVMQLTWTGQVQHMASVASSPPPLLAAALTDSLLLLRQNPITGEHEV
jgi:hypothetical protein